MLRWLKKSTKKRGKAKRRPVRGARGYTPRGSGPRLSSGAAAQSPRAPERRAGVAPTSRPRKQPRKQAGSTWYRSQRFWIGFVSLSFMAVVVGVVFLVIISHDLPDIEKLQNAKEQHGIRLVSEEGSLIATFGEIYGETIPYARLPKSLIEAVLATEDRRFFAHGGVDVLGIARAMFVNARAGRVVQGGSTITQQLAKNMFLTPERTLKRKVQEAILAFYLEGRYSKQEILGIYLNRVYLGAGAYGVDAAARRYFDKSARDLTLDESAMLAGLLKAPSRYAPTSNGKRARDRARQVLLNMVDADFITKEQAKQAMTALAKPASDKVVEGSGSRYFADWVVDSLPDYIGEVDADIEVTTTLLPENQKLAEDALTNVMATEGPAKNIKQAALVSMSPDGAVRAMVGGINYGSSQYNRAAQAKRQAGSTFKLFVYLAALEAGYSPQSQVLDAPISMQVGNRVWSPTNFSGDYKGEIPMWMAVRQSINTAAVRVSQAVGLYRVASMAKRLGIAQVTPAPSIALGAVEVSLTEITGAYAHLAAEGMSVKPYGIVKIATTGGKVLYDRGDAGRTMAINSDVVHMMNFMLRGAVQSGTATRAALPGRDVAGKTGTSQDFKDAWFVGYTPQLVTGIWVGNDDNSPMKKVTGGNVPAMIWHDYMAQALKGKPVLGLPVSEGASTGFLPWQADNVPGDTAVDPITGQPEDTQAAPVENVPFGGPTPPPAAAPQPMKKAKDGDILDEKFWDQLLNEAAQPKVEYSYPDGR